MAITRAHLQSHMATIRNQIAAYTGALQFAEQLMQELEAAESVESEMTVDEFAEMVGGEGATADISPNGYSRE